MVVGETHHFRNPPTVLFGEFPHGSSLQAFTAAHRFTSDLWIQRMERWNPADQKKLWNWNNSKSLLVGGFKYLYFHPYFGEMIQFDEHIFQLGWFNHQLDYCWGMLVVGTPQYLQGFFFNSQVVPWDFWSIKVVPFIFWANFWGHKKHVKTPVITIVPSHSFRKT